MNVKDITTLVRFNFWANDRLLEACERLSTDKLTRPVSPDPGWGSLRGVLAHILDAEYGWRAVLQGLDADIILEEADFRNVAALRARWEVEKAAWLDYLSLLSDAELEQRSEEESPGGLTAWQTIVHVITHGIQHRSEAAMILTGYGQSPGELDFDVFLRGT